MTPKQAHNLLYLLQGMSRRNYRDWDEYHGLIKCHANGVVIQRKDYFQEGIWHNIPSPNFLHPPSFYRIRPEMNNDPNSTDATTPQPKSELDLLPEESFDPVGMAADIYVQWLETKEAEYLTDTDLRMMAERAQAAVQIFIEELGNE